MEALCFRPLPAMFGMPVPPPAAAINLDFRAPSRHRPCFKVCAAGENGVAGEPPAEAARRLRPGGASFRLDEVGGVEERTEGEEEEDEGGSEDVEEEEETATGIERRRGAGNWVLKILRARLARSADDDHRGGSSGGEIEPAHGEDRRPNDNGEDGDRALEGGDRCAGCCAAEEELRGGCQVAMIETGTGLERDAFVRLLRRVTLKEARLLARLSYLGRLAYNISEIKPAHLLQYLRLRFVTSSLHKKHVLPTSDDDNKVQLVARSGDCGLGSRARRPELEQELESPRAEKVAAAAPEPQRHGDRENERGERKSGRRRLVNAAYAYKVAATAASYLQSRTRGILPFGSAGSSDLGLGTPKTNGAASWADEDGDHRLLTSDVASFVATTNSVTAVVAAKEETKQAVAKDLNSSNSSPCEWFVCDDDSSRTRFFVIQGSESVASWQANLLFEPVQFEGMDVMVHRGIYEAAKGIYLQMLPYVRGHLSAHGSAATFRLTGHSLGGSLSLLVSLMLRIRGEVPASSLLPVVTFGSPYIMCGGDCLLRQLGLPPSYVKAVMMHRDIVPRAFSCSYPDHVREILKAVNGKFRNHPCLVNQRLLYEPMGQLLVLQPEEKYSPPHDLLPAGTGLYVLRHKSPGSSFRESARMLRLAQSTFLNTPHPLEVLSDRAAYGSEGTVYRDHDVNAYLSSLRGIICQELKLIRRYKRELRRRRRRHQTQWPAGEGISVDASDSMDSQAGGPGRLHRRFFSAFQGGMQSMGSFGRFFSSRDQAQTMLVLLLPSKTLLVEVLRATSFTWARW